MEEGKLEREWVRGSEREPSWKLFITGSGSNCQSCSVIPNGSSQPQRDTELPSVPKSLPKQWSALNLKSRQLPYCKHDGIMPILLHIPEIQAWLLFCAPAWLVIELQEMRYIKYRWWHGWEAIRWDKGKCCWTTSAALRFARFESEADVSLSGPVWLPCRVQRLVFYPDTDRKSVV